VTTNRDAKHNSLSDEAKASSLNSPPVSLTLSEKCLWTRPTFMKWNLWQVSTFRSFSESCISRLKMNWKWNMYIRPFRVRVIASIKRFIYKIKGWWIISYNLALRVSIWPRLFRYHIIRKCNLFSYRVLLNVNDAELVNRWLSHNLLQ